MLVISLVLDFLHMLFSASHSYMHCCTRVVPVNEEVKVEVPGGEGSEVVLEPESCGAPAPTVFALQGKPRCI